MGARWPSGIMRRLKTRTIVVCPRKRPELSIVWIVPYTRAPWYIPSAITVALKGSPSMEYLLVRVSSMRMGKEVHWGMLKLEFCGAGFARVVKALGIRRARTEIRDGVRRTRK